MGVPLPNPFLATVTLIHSSKTCVSLIAATGCYRVTIYLYLSYKTVSCSRQEIMPFYILSAVLRCKQAATWQQVNYCHEDLCLR